MMLGGLNQRPRARLIAVALLVGAAGSAATQEAGAQPSGPPPRPAVEPPRSSARRGAETIPVFPRPTTAPRDVLEAPLALRDAELGLGPSGQIVATVDRIAQDHAPRDGRGIVRVVIDENGRVSSVVSTSPSWDAAAIAMERALGERQFGLPRGVRTVVLSFDVVARTTQVPSALTGEESQSRASWPQGVQGSSPSDAPAPVVRVPVESLLPVTRHLVSVTLFRVEPQ